MKTTNIFTLIALCFTFSFSATAQQTTLSFNRLNSLVGGAETPHIAAYVANPLADRNNAWWKSLERELSIAGQSYQSVPVESMQNLIFFQANHGDKVDLAPSIPTLLDLYNYHNSADMRIMAIAALAQIGDASSLASVERTLYKQRNTKVRNYTIAALQDYKNN